MVHDYASRGLDICGVCKMKYNLGDRIPRILVHCGHTFCTSCLIRYYHVDHIRCPYCKKLINNIESVSKIESLPLNLNIFGELVKTDPLVMRLIDPENPNSLSSQCSFHPEKQKHFYCSYHEKNFCSDTYTVTWDSAALQQMVPMAQQKLDQLEDITFEALMGSEAENITAYAIVTVLGQVDEHVDNIQAYVNSDGCLAGLYFHVVNDCALAIHLDGAENIWQHITVNYIPDANGDWQNEPETLEITTQIANGKMRITAAMQGDYDEGGAIEYNDADGTIRIISEDEDYDEEETYTVAIRPNGNGVSFVVEYSMDYTDSWYDDDSSMTYSNSAHLEFVLAPLSGSIQALSANPRNLLSMTEQELEEFAMQCESNFESLDELFD